MSVKNRTINELQNLMNNGQLTSEIMVENALNSINANSHYNAFISVDGERAKAQALELDKRRAEGEFVGPLHGIVLCVKDNIHVAGVANTAGTPILKDFHPKNDASAIALLKQAGAIIIGKNNLHELAYGITSDNKAFGSVKNALNDEYIAGGSSGGTAVAVAMGMSTAGLGTDTGGSVRIPATLNGLVGFRPTVSRYPNDGLTSISNTRDTVGPITTSVSDAQLLDAVLSNGSAEANVKVSLKGLRIGVPRSYYYSNLEPVISEKIEQLLESLKSQGVELIEEDMPNLGELNERVSFPVVLFETNQLLNSYIADNLPNADFDQLRDSIADPVVQGLIDMARNGTIPQAVYDDVIANARPELQQCLSRYFSDNTLDAIIFPTTPLSARPILGAEETVEFNGEQVPTFATYIRNTDPATNAGIPALSLPLSVTDKGLPFGVELNGPENSDRRILAIGKAIEAALQQKQ